VAGINLLNGISAMGRGRWGGATFFILKKKAD
jgi:hypothetical protein